MRKRNFLCRLVAVGLVTELLLAGIMTGNTAHAKNDFEALLADVNFGAPAPLAPQSPEALQLPAAPAGELDAPPTSVPMSMPPAAAEAMPAPVAAQSAPATHNAPVGVAPVPVPQEAVAACDGQCNGCGGKCGSGGCNMFREGFCQPYTPPQLPTSTFYQYWRSNACNVNVWNGYRNRCHTRVDLSINHKPLCGKKLFGCKSGACDNVYNSPVQVDCGPAPSEWCDEGCDTCDGQ